MRTNRDTPSLDDLYRRLANQRMAERRKERYPDLVSVAQPPAPVTRYGPECPKCGNANNPQRSEI